MLFGEFTLMNEGCHNITLLQLQVLFFIVHLITLSVAQTTQHFRVG